MKFIVVDLEATCTETNENFRNEIIEIGAVKINEELEIESSFSEFIRPLVNPVLSDFCKKLTTINQNDVDYADEFPNVVERFKEWVGIYDDEEYILCSWGFYDKYQFEKDCKLYKLDSEWVDNHISLKHQFGEIKGIRPCGLDEALKMLGMKFTGTQHRGIDDANNIANIFIEMYNHWRF